MQKHICIYQIRSLRDGKIYIGSSKCSGKRKNEHFARLRVGKHGNSKLQRAYNKYGESNFVFEVLEIVDEISLLETKEQFYLDTLKPFYNICLIANSIQGIPRTKEWAAKIGKSNIGRQVSDETRLKMRLARLGRPPANKGVPMSDETKRKVSESKKGTTSWNKGIKTGRNEKQIAAITGRPMREDVRLKRMKPVHQIDKKTLKIIKTWPSGADAGRALKINIGNIATCCTGNGNQKTVGGFIWRTA